MTGQWALHPNAVKSVEAPVMYPYLKTRRQLTMSTFLWWTGIVLGAAMLAMLLIC